MSAYPYDAYITAGAGAGRAQSVFLVDVHRIESEPTWHDHIKVFQLLV